MVKHLFQQNGRAELAEKFRLSAQPFADYITRRLEAKADIALDDEEQAVGIFREFWGPLHRAIQSSSHGSCFTRILVESKISDAPLAEIRGNEEDLRTLFQYFLMPESLTWQRTTTRAGLTSL